MDSVNQSSMKPIGFMKSIFHFKNGTPRQSSLCQAARGIITIEKSVFNNPEHSLEGLQEFSHAWIIFVFHKNNNAHSKAKVKPPRLNGRRVGVFSTRSPYRPNNIGLSLAKIDSVDGSTVHLSGIDILDGTPILDIKPYIAEYDAPTMVNDTMRSDTSLIDGQALHTGMMSDSSSDFPGGGIKPDPCLDDFHGINRTSQQKVGAQSLISNRLSDEKFPPVRCSEGRFQPKKEDTFSNHQLSEGFYSMSAALDKSGAKMTSNGCDTDCSMPEDAQEKVDNLTNTGEEFTTNYEQFDVSEIFANSLLDDANSDQYVDLLVNNVLSNAASHLDELGSERESIVNSLSFPSNVDMKGSVEMQSSTSVLCNSKCENTSCVQQAAGDNVNNHTTEPSSKGNVKQMSSSLENNSSVSAPWLINPPVHKLNVTYTPDAIEQLSAFSIAASDERYRLQLISNPEEARAAISSILHEEPRSIYRRKHCQDKLYFFAIDVLHVTCWFHGDTVQVLQVNPVKDVPVLNRSCPDIND